MRISRKFCKREAENYVTEGPQKAKRFLNKIGKYLENSVQTSDRHTYWSLDIYIFSIMPLVFEPTNLIIETTANVRQVI